MNYWLTNVRLESGYHREDGRVTATETEICHIRVENGKVGAIVSANEAPDATLPHVDAKGLLALPPFVEKHCHLDKSYVGTPWRAVRPADNLYERFDIERAVLAFLPIPTKERAKAQLDLLMRSGSTHIRTHVDISPSVGLKNLEAVQEALAEYEGKLSYEIVAFPQDGLLRSKSADLVREAVRQGCGLVGGVDPANVDLNIEASLSQMMEIATEGDSDVDLHLHDPGHLGLFTIKRLAALTMEAGWQGRVSVSHAYGLGDLTPVQAAAAAELLAEAGMGIITSVPINASIPPVGLLREKGVAVAVGCDNIYDSWSSFGNGDILERAGRLMERFGWTDELSLSQGLGFITNGKTPLDEQGNRTWPQVGDDASMVLLHASCVAEAVARRSERQASLFRGRVVSGDLG